MASMRLLRLALPGAAAILLALAWSGGTLTSVEAGSGDSAGADTREISDQLRNPADPQSLLVDGSSVATRMAQSEAIAADATIGDQVRWVALNDFFGYYTKVFELRAQDDTGQVWVAVGEGRDPDANLDGILGLNFPDGDCRNDGVRNVVTDEQAEYLLDQFTNQIKGTDEAWFGEPDFRDGSDPGSPLARPDSLGRQVILVDNVRDDAFYDTDNQNTLPYIAGFFTSAMDFFHDRNVMTIDGFDWLHRTGADPLHEPSSDPCTVAQARPFLYEGVFAHEYQHLIHNDYDPDEQNWVNEGMSDLAIFLNGYSDPTRRVDEKGNDSHVMAYEGWLAVEHPDWNPIPRPSGPENSLTQWQDQGPTEILEDYGFAYSFMMYLYDHGYGQDFFAAWHHNTLNGIQGLNVTLAAFGSNDNFYTLFQDLTVSTLVDAYIDAGGSVSGDSASDLQSDSMNSTVFFSPDAYDTQGAPPWGADYIPLGPGNKFSSLAFDGGDSFVFPGGNDWTIDADGYMTSPDEPGETVYANSTDSSIAHEVTVPAAPATLTFEHWYQTEATWDFGFVQVLDGENFVSLPCTGTTSVHDPAADPSIAVNVPGYSGPTQDPSDPTTAGTPAAPLAESCDLSAYAGQTIVLAFRLMTDTSVQFDGWHIRNVAINGTPVDSTPGDISDWDNEQFFQPLSLGFSLTLVGINGSVDEFGHVTSAQDITVVRADLNAGATFSLGKKDEKALKHADEIVAIVAGIPDDEGVGVYFPYSLMVNGHEMADGAGIP